MKKAFQRCTTVAAALLLVGMTSHVWADHGSNNTETRLRTKLSGAAIQGKTPEGSADFRSDTRGRMRLDVEVENVNLPSGTMLQVAVTRGTATILTGNITLKAGGAGELELNSQDGDTVPMLQSGDMITVSNAGTAILAGVF